MKKLLFTNIFILLLLSTSFTVSADDWSGSQYRWSTTEQFCSSGSCSDYRYVTSPQGWPFDDGHFLAAFYGDNATTSFWLLEHYHLYWAQKQTLGDAYRLDKINLYDSSDGRVASYTDHSGHFHQKLNTTESVTRNFYAAKNKSKITFEITHWQAGPNGVIQEIFYGRKYRDGRYDGLSF